MSDVETEGKSSLRYVIGPAGDGVSFAEEIIEPGSQASLDTESSGEKLTLILADGISMRKTRLTGSKLEMGEVVDCLSGSTFHTKDGEIAIVFNRGKQPVRKRKITFGPQSEFYE